MTEDLERRLAKHLGRVSAPEGIWDRIQARVSSAPRGARRIAASLFLMLAAGAVWYLHAAPNLQSDPAVRIVAQSKLPGGAVMISFETHDGPATLVMPETAGRGSAHPDMKVESYGPDTRYRWDGYTLIARSSAGCLICHKRYT